MSLEIYNLSIMWTACFHLTIKIIYCLHLYTHSTSFDTYVGILNFSCQYTHHCYLPLASYLGMGTGLVQQIPSIPNIRRLPPSQSGTGPTWVASLTYETSLKTNCLVLCLSASHPSCFSHEATISNPNSIVNFSHSSIYPFQIKKKMYWLLFLLFC